MKTHIVTTQDGQKIHFDQYKHNHSKVVIIAHGFFNSKDAELLKDLGKALEDQYDVIIMDFRGHGKSEGLFYWTSKEHLDLKAVVEYTKEHYQKIAVIGFSLGAATSIITASQIDTIDTVIAVSAPTEFEKIEYHFWSLDVQVDLIYSLIGEGRVGKGVRPGPFWQKKDKPIERITHIKCPILFIHGEEDWLIKPAHSKELFAKAPTLKRLAIIKGGPHAEYLILKNKDETLNPIREWLKEYL